MLSSASSFILSSFFFYSLCSAFSLSLSLSLSLPLSVCL